MDTGFNFSPTFYLAADTIVFCTSNRSVLLIKRANEPFRGSFAFPGGFVEPDEKVIHGALRELREETSLNLAEENLNFLSYYDDITRDPRGRVITFTFYALVKNQLSVKAKDDAKEALFVPIHEAKRANLAFDHFKMLGDFLKKLG